MVASFAVPDVGEYSCTRIKRGQAPARSAGGAPMPELSRERLERYLATLFHAPVAVTALVPLRESKASGAAKEYGYGHPVKVEFIVGAERRVAHLKRSNGRFFRRAGRGRIFLHADKQAGHPRRIRRRRADAGTLEGTAGAVPHHVVPCAGDRHRPGPAS